MGLDIHYLKTFYYLGLIKNYTETAKRLFITQSAVSHSIKKLESSVGVNLIEKNKQQKFSLTEYGEMLFKVCDNIFTQIDNIEEVIKNRSQEKEISVKIGATVEFGTTFLINNMKKFMSSNPNFHIDYLFHHSLFDKLLRNEIDIIIDCIPHFHESVEPIFLCDEPFVVISTPEYAKENSLNSIKDFPKAQILSIDSDGIWWEKFMSVALKKEQISLGKTIKINHIRGLINAVLNGIGISLVPKYTVESELKEGSLIEIFNDVKSLEDKFYIYIKKEKLKLEKYQLLINYFKNYL